MTALPPIENRRVRGVLTSKYPTNKICAHPECDEPANSVHHCFPRSLIGNGSFFVEIDEGEGFKGPKGSHPICNDGVVIPHAVGLCGSGTTGHHGEAEMHDGWIKYEDGSFVWYSRSEEDGPDGRITVWTKVGNLNPQPGSREGKPKRRRKQGDERRKRKVISIRVPDDEEDGAAIWDETLEDVKDRLVREGLKDRPEDLSVYVALIAALRDWLNG